MPRDLSPAERPIVIGWLEAQLADLKALGGPVPVEPAAPAQPTEPDHNPGFPSQEDEGRFYDWLRDNDMLGPVITPDEFKGCDAITRACAEARWPLSWTAYALATAYHETAHTMMPVLEAYWLSPAKRAAYYRRMYDIQGARPAKARELGNVNPGDGARFPGRGYPQLTGRTNYLKAGTALGIDLIANPDLALKPSVAAQIMVRGMREGWFTSADIDDDLPATGQATLQEFTRSRDIINGTDKQKLIAEYALDWQSALAAGRWVF